MVLTLLKQITIPKSPHMDNTDPPPPPSLIHTIKNIYSFDDKKNKTINFEDGCSFWFILRLSFHISSIQIKKNCTFVFAAMFSTWYFRFYLRQPDVWKYYFGSFLRLTTSILELQLRKKFFDFVEIIKMPREGRYLSNFIVFSPYLTSNMTRIFFIRSYLIIGI